MPVVQVTGGTRPATTQLDLRQMVGEVQEWNPEATPLMVRRFIQNAYRRLVDERHWYGQLVRGQVTVQDAVTGGAVAVTHGSLNVVGTGTAFTAAMEGRQFRVGFGFPIYTIDVVNSATSLDLRLPWGGPTLPSASYQIFENIVSFGDNIKKLHTVVNQRQGYRLKLHIPQEVLNIYDTWRTTTGWTFLVANAEPSPEGAPQFELYPAPTFQQAFPFLAYTQPQDMSTDASFPVAYIRSDILVAMAISHVLRFRKDSQYYDPAQANYFESLAQNEIKKAVRHDNDLYQKDLMWEFERYPFTQFGADWHQSHDIDTYPL